MVQWYILNNNNNNNNNNNDKYYVGLCDVAQSHFQHSVTSPHTGHSQ